DLLDERERLLFRRLSIFSGGFELPAAEAVCAGGGLERDDVGPLLFELVEKSLVVPDLSRPGPTRYRLLETVRQYGAARLDRGGERAELAARHAAHYLALAEGAEREQLGDDQPWWLQRLETELGNVRAALGWLRRADVDGWLRLASALAWFWVTH